MTHPARIAYQPDQLTPPGETLVELLTEHGISQRELAQCMGVSPRTIAALLRGQAPLTPTMAEKLAAIVAVPAEYWLNHEALYRASLPTEKAL